jgi:hypothetical protein
VTSSTEPFACAWCPGDGEGDHASDCAKRERHPLDVRVGDRITFWWNGKQYRGIVRGFEGDQIIVDIDPPLKGAAGASLGRRTERRNIVKRI